MAKKHDVIIYMRDIFLEVVIPKRYVWEFMEEFGEAFATHNGMEGGEHLKSVEGYHEHPNGWHVKVKVYEGDEKKFYTFLREFCSDRKISFMDPRTDE